MSIRELGHSSGVAQRPSRSLSGTSCSSCLLAAVLGINVNHLAGDKKAPGNTDVADIYAPLGGLSCTFYPPLRAWTIVAQACQGGPRSGSCFEFGHSNRYESWLSPPRRALPSHQRSAQQPLGGRGANPLHMSDALIAAAARKVDVGSPSRRPTSSPRRKGEILMRLVHLTWGPTFPAGPRLLAGPNGCRDG